MTDHTNGISQDMYSSASSDDQSSVNTVIHVPGNNETVDTPGSERQNFDLGEADGSSVGLIQKDDEDSTSDSEDEHLNRDVQDSDSSSTSEDTQV